ncbi:alpha/beta hydrolase [Paenibacillus albidus]|uniref:alpha/beta fold hydrolase n=1 Tax=Paenibacillus albidus TaxID=2041023 RepID=UPI001BED1BD3|nr:alpha/beta hydrolase [Paenibacillus albidus]MBT2291419.1 alpha/beta hydrolase [Paenibacillus albidus]
MIEVTMHDGAVIEAEVQGTGPDLLLPVNPHPATGTRAEEMLKWGADPALGRSLIEGLSGHYRVIAFDYEGHIQQTPKPDTLTPANISSDFLAIADAAGALRFAYYGYSWLALSGMQLALRTNRLSALIMGGFPPIEGPYKEMLRVTAATYEMAASPAASSPDTGNVWDGNADEFDWSTVEVTMSEAQTKQFVTLYQSLQDFEDHAVQSSISCPRLCFAGSADRIEYGERWGNVTVNIAGPLLNQHHELEALGWKVSVLEGLDHTGAMQAAKVLPLLRPWLDSKLLSI